MGNIKMKHESEYETAYAEAEKAKGSLCPKLVTPGEQGYPDRLVLRGVGPMKEVFRTWVAYVMNSNHAITLDELDKVAETMLAAAIRFVEFKKDADSPFQPRQPRVISMLRERGFRVDVYEGDRKVDN